MDEKRPRDGHLALELRLTTLLSLKYYKFFYLVFKLLIWSMTSLKFLIHEVRLVCNIKSLTKRVTMQYTHDPWTKLTIQVILSKTKPTQYPTHITQAQPTTLSLSDSPLL